VGTLTSGRISFLLIILFSLGLVLSAGYTIRIIKIVVFSRKFGVLQRELTRKKIHLILRFLARLAVVVGFMGSYNIFLIEERFSFRLINIFYSYVLALIRGLLVNLPWRFQSSKVVPLLFYPFIRRVTKVFFQISSYSSEKLIIRRPHVWGISIPSSYSSTLLGKWIGKLRIRSGVLVLGGLLVFFSI
jgi:hypothetical protein